MAERLLSIKVQLQLDQVSTQVKAIKDKLADLKIPVIVEDVGLKNDVLENALKERRNLVSSAEKQRQADIEKVNRQVAKSHQQLERASVASFDEMKRQAVASYQQISRSSAASARDIEQAEQVLLQKLIQIDKQRERAAEETNQKISQSFRELGLKSTAEIEAKKRKAIAAYDAIRASGTATAKDLENAQVALNKKLQHLERSINLKVEMDTTPIGQAIEKFGERVKDLVSLKNAGNIFTRSIGSIFRGFQEGIGITFAQKITGGSIASLEKRLGQSLDRVGEKFYDTLAKGGGKVADKVLIRIGVEDGLESVKKTLSSIAADFDEIVQGSQIEAKLDVFADGLAGVVDKAFDLKLTLKDVVDLLKQAGDVALSPIDGLKARRQRMAAEAGKNVQSVVEEGRVAPLDVDGKKAVVIVSGGYAGRGGKSSSEVGSQIARLTGEQASVVAVPNYGTDVKTGVKESYPKWMIQALARLTQNNLGRVNPDALNMVAQALQARKQNPEIKIVLAGHSAGGFTARQAQEILNELGIEGVESFGIGTPQFGENKTPGYQSTLGDNDRIRDIAQFLGLSDEGKVAGVEGHGIQHYLKNPEIQARLAGAMGVPVESLQQVDFQPPSEEMSPNLKVAVQALDVLKGAATRTLSQVISGFGAGILAAVEAEEDPIKAFMGEAFNLEGFKRSLAEARDDVAKIAGIMAPLVQKFQAENDLGVLDNQLKAVAPLIQAVEPLVMAHREYQIKNTALPLAQERAAEILQESEGKQVTPEEMQKTFQKSGKAKESGKKVKGIPVYKAVLGKASDKNAPEVMADETKELIIGIGGYGGVEGQGGKIVAANLMDLVADEQNKSLKEIAELRSDIESQLEAVANQQRQQFPDTIDALIQRNPPDMEGVPEENVQELLEGYRQEILGKLEEKLAQDLAQQRDAIIQDLVKNQGYVESGDFVRPKVDKSFISVANPDSDIDLTKDQNVEIAKSLGKVNARGYSKDAVEVAAQAIAAKTKNPDIQIKIFGFSSGGFVAEEAMAILKEAGIDAEYLAQGTPDLAWGIGEGKNKSISTDEYLGEDTARIAKMGLARIDESELLGPKDHLLSEYMNANDPKFMKFFYGSPTPATLEEIQPIKKLASDLGNKTDRLLANPLQASPRELSDIAGQAYHFMNNVRDQLSVATEETRQELEELSKTFEEIYIRAAKEPMDFSDARYYLQKAADGIPAMQETKGPGDMFPMVADHWDDPQVEVIEKQRQEVLDPLLEYRKKLEKKYGNSSGTTKRKLDSLLIELDKAIEQYSAPLSEFLQGTSKELIKQAEYLDLSVQSAEPEPTAATLEIPDPDVELSGAFADLREQALLLRDVFQELTESAKTKVATEPVEAEVIVTPAPQQATAPAINFPSAVAPYELVEVLDPYTDEQKASMLAQAKAKIPGFKQAELVIANYVDDVKDMVVNKLTTVVIEGFARHEEAMKPLANAEQKVFNAADKVFLGLPVMEGTKWIIQNMFIGPAVGGMITGHVPMAGELMHAIDSGVHQLGAAGGELAGQMMHVPDAIPHQGVAGFLESGLEHIGAGNVMHPDRLVAEGVRELTVHGIEGFGHTQLARNLEMDVMENAGVMSFRSALGGAKNMAEAKSLAKAELERQFGTVDNFRKLTAEQAKAYVDVVYEVMDSQGTSVVDIGAHRTSSKTKVNMAKMLQSRKTIEAMMQGRTAQIEGAGSMEDLMRLITTDADKGGVFTSKQLPSILDKLGFLPKEKRGITKKNFADRMAMGAVSFEDLKAAALESARILEGATTGLSDEEVKGYKEYINQYTKNYEETLKSLIRDGYSITSEKVMEVVMDMMGLYENIRMFAARDLTPEQRQIGGGLEGQLRQKIDDFGPVGIAIRGRIDQRIRKKLRPEDMVATNSEIVGFAKGTDSLRGAMKSAVPTLSPQAAAIGDIEIPVNESSLQQAEDTEKILNQIQETLNSLPDSLDIISDPELQDLQVALEAVNKIAELSKIAQIQRDAYGKDELLNPEMAKQYNEIMGKVSPAGTQSLGIVAAYGPQLKEAAAAGNATAQGFINGLKNAEAKLEAEGDTLALGFIQSVKQVLDIQSPSRVMQWIGEMAGEGFVKGLVGSLQKGEELSEEQLDAIYDAYRNHQIFDENYIPIEQKEARSQKQLEEMTAYVKDGQYIGDTFVPTLPQAMQEAGRLEKAKRQEQELGTPFYSPYNKMMHEVDRSLDRKAAADKIKSQLPQLPKQVLEPQVTEKVEQFSESVAKATENAQEFVEVVRKVPTQLDLPMPLDMQEIGRQGVANEIKSKLPPLPSSVLTPAEDEWQSVVKATPNLPLSPQLKAAYAQSQAAATRASQDIWAETIKKIPNHLDLPMPAAMQEIGRQGILANDDPWSNPVTPAPKLPLSPSMKLAYAQSQAVATKNSDLHWQRVGQFTTKAPPGGQEAQNQRIAAVRAKLGAQSTPDPAVGQTAEKTATAVKTLNPVLGKLGKYLSSAKIGLTDLAEALAGVGDSSGIAEIAFRGLDGVLQFGLRHLKEVILGFIGFNVLQQVGPMLMDFGRQTLGLSIQLEALRTSMTATFGSSAAAAREFEYVRDVSEKLNLPLVNATKNYQRFAAALKGTQFEGGRTREMFENITQASRVYGLSQEEIDGVLLAAQQVMGKGTVAAEELRGQIGERLPGAFTKFAQSMGISVEELNKKLELGTVGLNDFYKFTVFLAEDTAAGVDAANATTQASLDKFAREVQTIMIWVGDALRPAAKFFIDFGSGAVKALGAVGAVLAKTFAVIGAIGNGIGTIASTLGSVLMPLLKPIGQLLGKIGQVIAFAAEKTAILQIAAVTLSVAIAQKLIPQIAAMTMQLIGMATTSIPAAIAGLQSLITTSLAFIATPIGAALAALAIGATVAAPELDKVGLAMGAASDNGERLSLIFNQLINNATYLFRLLGIPIPELDTGESVQKERDAFIALTEEVEKARGQLQQGLPLNDKDFEDLIKRQREVAAAAGEAAHVTAAHEKELRRLQSIAKQVAPILDEINRIEKESARIYKVKTDAVAVFLAQQKALIAEAQRQGLINADQARERELQAEQQAAKDKLAAIKAREAAIQKQLAHFAWIRTKTGFQLTKEQQEQETRLQDDLAQILQEGYNQQAEIHKREIEKVNAIIDRAAKERVLAYKKMMASQSLTQDEGNRRIIESDIERIKEQIANEGDGIDRRTELFEKEQELRRLLVEQAEQESLEAIQKRLNAGVITQKQAEAERAKATLKRIQETAKVEGDSHKNTLERLQAEREAQEKLAEVAAELIERNTTQYEQKTKRVITALDERKAREQALSDNLDIQSKAIEQQNKLLEARKSLTAAIANLTQTEADTQGQLLGAMSKFAKTDAEKLQIEQLQNDLALKTAQQKLAALKQEQEAARQALTLQIQQNELAAKREQIAARIAEIENRSSILQTQSELVKAQGEREKILARKDLMTPEEFALALKGADLEVASKTSQLGVLGQKQDLLGQRTGQADQELDNSRKLGQLQIESLFRTQSAELWRAQTDVRLAELNKMDPQSRIFGLQTPNPQTIGAVTPFNPAPAFVQRATMPAPLTTADLLRISHNAPPTSLQAPNGAPSSAMPQTIKVDQPELISRVEQLIQIGQNVAAQLTGALNRPQVQNTVRNTTNVLPRGSQLGILAL